MGEQRKVEGVKYGPLDGIGRVGHAGTSKIGVKRHKLIREKDRRLEEEKRERAWVQSRGFALAEIMQGQFVSDRHRADTLREVLDSVYRLGRADLLAETLAGM